ncbi:MAG: polyphosphate kinase 1 [Treponema sp.]|jgi:polyphosphate kinase|nr:polyphosphate kinase 1 [Treponema sp.]
MERLNRELSWINYNGRVLEEGLRRDLPPLERFLFLSIVSANFDEFFMVRVAALKRAVRLQGAAEADNNGEDPSELIRRASALIRPVFTRLYGALEREILPALARGGLEFRRPPFDPDETGYLKPLFKREILPVLSPLRFGPVRGESAEAPPLVAGGVLYGAFLLEASGIRPEPDPGAAPRADPGAAPEPERYIAIAAIPQTLDRIIRIDGPGSAVQRWVLLDDLLMLWGDALFPGYEVRERLLFRIHRDADFSVDEKRDEDFVEAMEEMLVNREQAAAVWMVHTETAGGMAALIARRLGLADDAVLALPGPLGLGGLGGLARFEGFEALKRKSPRPCPHPAFPGDVPVWDPIREGDILLNLPYHSFDPVVRFFQEAAEDPAVLSIKTTLYRTSGNSPVIRALEQAAANGKHVTAVVELKARFDEERNISWANRLEKAGVIVIYGLARLKIHAKICQVIRREAAGLRRYLHFSTGNYNDRTARLYSDLCLFSCREDLGEDATLVFNTLSGYSSPLSMRSLVMAPRNLKQRLIELIDREAKRGSQGSPGRIMAKMNALVDDDVVRALYRASAAGVKISLNIRGICTLVPGAPGLSENIRVVSIVGSVLEHSRILYVSNGGAEEFYLSSADWMPRNLERRVELLVPVLDGGIREELRNILEAYFRDNTHAWTLEPDGTWKRRSPSGEKAFGAQEYLQSRAEQAADRRQKTREDFTVRRGREFV